MIISLLTPRASQLLLWGLIVHLVCDWLLQNHWMAINKANPHHAAGYIHALIHYSGLLLVFPWYVALFIAVTHFAIDLRVPLVWWRAFYKQTTDEKNPASLHVSMWGDQVLHILVLAVVAIVVARVS